MKWYLVSLSDPQSDDGYAVFVVSAVDMREAKRTIKRKLKKDRPDLASKKTVGRMITEEDGILYTNLQVDKC